MYWFEAQMSEQTRSEVCVGGMTSLDCALHVDTEAQVRSEDVEQGATSNSTATRHRVHELHTPSEIKCVAPGEQASVSHCRSEVGVAGAISISFSSHGGDRSRH